MLSLLEHMTPFTVAPTLYAVKAQLVCMRIFPGLGDFLSPPQLLSNLPSLLINISLTGPIRKVVLLYQSKRRDLSWNRLGDNIKKKMQWKVQYELSRSPFTQIPHLLYLPCESTLFPSSYFLEIALVRVFTQPTFNPRLDHSLLQQRLGFPLAAILLLFFVETRYFMGN